MEIPSLDRIYVAFAVIGVVIVLTRLFPRARWAQFLNSKQGPSLDPRGLSRMEAWRAAGGYLLIGAISLGLAIGSGWLGDRLYGAFDRSPVFTALSFMAGLGTLLGIGGAVYMAFRGFFRPANMFRWREDPLSQATFLKGYDSADGSARAVIFEHAGPEYEIVAVEPAPPDAEPGVTTRVIDNVVLRTLHRTTSLEEAERAARAATGHQ